MFDSLAISGRLGSGIFTRGWLWTDVTTAAPYALLLPAKPYLEAVITVEEY